MEEEENLHGTPIKLLTMNMIGALDFTETSTEAINGSEGNLTESFMDLNVSRPFVVSTFESEASLRIMIIDIIPATCVNEGETFVMEGHLPVVSRDDFHGEPDTSRSLAPLHLAPVLKDTTKTYPATVVPESTFDTLDDLMEASIDQIEDTCGLKLDNAYELCTFGGRGNNYTSERLGRNRERPVLVTRKTALGLPYQDRKVGKPKMGRKEHLTR